MHWVKATTRLPESAGKENKVVMKYGGFVTWGFKNFSDEPQMYFVLGNESFLQNEGVVWLDEAE